ncbi:2,5-didehydrogluconate reductase [Caulobacter sp. Root655]|uniref:aldo/keto reductase n=1 Tax=Caulobacter sp. Root655 TaxID=1736578 RepID=UPI0006F22370|nr:aldo/keto reductase [Caulobacter sp. Root655]KRA66146.1 2,5-didehydrogluconate reductase [Caulobacter sp. Root655]
MPHSIPDIRSGDVAMPVIGLGTWQLEDGSAQPLVERALELGYRHIDTAQIYGNEQDVGAALAATGVSRAEIFLTTKVWVEHFAHGDLQRSLDESLRKLRVPQVDLLLLHWPKPRPALAETMAALNDVRDRGLTRAIGLSNFPSGLMAKAQAASEAPIATNQVEYHPYLSQKTLIAKARAIGASITAWSPLAQGKVAGDPVLIEIGEAHGKTPGQVTLRWQVQQGVVTIPRTRNPARLAENFDIFDFALSDAEMARISALARPDGRLGDWLDKAFEWDVE